MRLSSRRTWCALGLLVMLIAGMVIEPVARGAKQFAVYCASGGDVSVSNLSFHRKQELLEINNLRSVHTSGSSQVDLSTERALIKIELADLIDNRLISPRSKLQGVRIELASFATAPAPSVQPATFQAKLNSVLSALKWDKIQTDCEAILTADDVLQELDSKMRSWLMRSQQIMFHADQLTANVQSFSNPLRHASEIRNQMKQIEQLRAEQANLEKQFQSVSTNLEQQTNLIRSASQRDVDSLRAKASRESATVQNEAAEQLVREWATELLDSQCKLAHSVSLALGASNDRNPMNVNVRNNSKLASGFDFADVEASGEFIHGNDSFAFVAAGGFQLLQMPSYRVEPKTNLVIDFCERNIASHLALESQSYSSSWSLRATSADNTTAENSPSNKMLSIEAINATTDGAVDDKLLELYVQLTGETLSGIAKLYTAKLETLKRLPCAGNADLAGDDTSLSTALSAPIESSNSVGNGADQWIEFEISGTALEPQVALKNALPKSLVDTLTERIQRKIDQQRIDCESKFNTALDSKLISLKKALESLAQQGLQSVSKQQATLADMQSELEQSLQARDNYEYARRPTAPASNR